MLSSDKETDYQAEDPFTYLPGEEPQEVTHKVIGRCVQCKEDAYTLDTHGNKSCWGCAYGTA